ncbi:unnamed protein product, partial [Ilex paraguariensis]
SGVVALVPMVTDYSGRFKRMSSERSVERLQNEKVDRDLNMKEVDSRDSCFYKHKKR